METEDTAALRGENAALKAALRVLIPHLPADRLGLQNHLHQTFAHAEQHLPGAEAWGQEGAAAARTAFLETTRALQQAVKHGRYR